MTNPKTKTLTAASFFFQTLSLDGTNPDREAPEDAKPERVHKVTSPKQLQEVVSGYKYVCFVSNSGKRTFILTENYKPPVAERHFKRFAK